MIIKIIAGRIDIEPHMGKVNFIYQVLNFYINIVYKYFASHVHIDPFKSNY